METEQVKTTGAAPNGSAQAADGDEVENEPRKRRGVPVVARQILIVAGAIVVLLVLIWGVRTIAYMMTHQSTDDAKVDADTVTVTSKISERVAAIFTDTNQHVR
ncbi:MAG: hypothetical protein JO359_00035, partial [Candidatus Eremiobacteraeota bacterium]|nr:hypothetical protein [Candidatus Eremiobacteraeota bacterium]